jgi:hypothetical protein
MVAHDPQGTPDVARFGDAYSAMATDATNNCSRESTAADSQNSARCQRRHQPLIQTSQASKIPAFRRSFFVSLGYFEFWKK